MRLNYKPPSNRLKIQKAKNTSIWSWCRKMADSFRSLSSLLICPGHVDFFVSEQASNDDFLKILEKEEQYLQQGWTSQVWILEF
jgi:hypothetical protein